MSETELTPEEIEKYRRLVKTADQRKKGSNITYERRMPDGSHITVQMNGATPEQVALIHWLQAEEAWKNQLEWDKKENQRKRKEAKKQQEQRDRNNSLITEHEALVAITPAGFRRDSLIRHAPTRSTYGYSYYDYLQCTSCYGTDYEPERVSFPCPEYVFITEWEATPEKDDND
jgi:hypothetical protein